MDPRSIRGTSTMGYKNPDQKRAYQREWLMSRRIAWIETNGPCKMCGSKNDLEIDHIDRSEKARDIATIWSLRKERREQELAKCQVLCASCHDSKTMAERGPSIVPHGNTRYGYGCRCMTCRHDHAKVNASYRQADRYG